MNIRQLQFIREVARNGFNVSAAAERLHATQPGVSTQIRQLEEELGIAVFERRGKRLTGITEGGRHILALAEEVLRGVENMRSVGDEFSREDRGTLVIATTHTQARYALPRAIPAFRARYPHIQLRIRQGNPTQICQLVLAGEADFVVATEAIENYDELLMLPCYRWNRCLVAPPGHPILEDESLTLEGIVRYPILTYDFAFTGRTAINKAFEEAGLSPNVILTAIDSDVLKAYVELGLGVGLLAKMAYDAQQDRNLRCRDASHLFEESVTRIGFRRDRFLRGYMYEFMALFAPHLTRRAVETAVRANTLD